MSRLPEAARPLLPAGRGATVAKTLAYYHQHGHPLIDRAAIEGAFDATLERIRWLYASPERMARLPVQGDEMLVLKLLSAQLLHMEHRYVDESLVWRARAWGGDDVSFLLQTYRDAETELIRAIRPHSFEREAGSHLRAYQTPETVKQHLANVIAVFKDGLHKQTQQKAEELVHRPEVRAYLVEKESWAVPPSASERTPIWAHETLVRYVSFVANRVFLPPPSSSSAAAAAESSVPLVRAGRRGALEGPSVQAADMQRGLLRARQVLAYLHEDIRERAVRFLHDVTDAQRTRSSALDTRDPVFVTIRSQLQVLGGLVGVGVGVEVHMDTSNDADLAKRIQREWELSGEEMRPAKRMVSETASNNESYPVEKVVGWFHEARLELAHAERDSTPDRIRTTDVQAAHKALQSIFTALARFAHREVPATVRQASELFRNQWDTCTEGDHIGDYGVLMEDVERLEALLPWFTSSSSSSSPDVSGRLRLRSRRVL